MISGRDKLRPMLTLKGDAFDLAKSSLGEVLPGVGVFESRIPLSVQSGARRPELSCRGFVAAFLPLL